MRQSVCVTFSNEKLSECGRGVSVPPRPGEFYIKEAWMRAGNFETNPFEVPRFCFVSKA